jgi:hypothetical protein
MQDNQQTASTWRIGIDLAAFVLLAAIAGMVAAMTLAGIALLITGAASTTDGAEAAPAAPAQVPATRPMVASRSSSQN